MNNAATPTTTTTTNSPAPPPSYLHEVIETLIDAGPDDADAVLVQARAQLAALWAAARGDADREEQFQQKLVELVIGQVCVDDGDPEQNVKPKMIVLLLALESEFCSESAAGVRGKSSPVDLQVCGAELFFVFV